MGANLFLMISNNRSLSAAKRASMSRAGAHNSASFWSVSKLRSGQKIPHIVEHYNNVRLNSAIGYITPKDMLAGHQQEIQDGRDRKLEAAREQRKNRRQRDA